MKKRKIKRAAMVAALKVRRYADMGDDERASLAVQRLGRLCARLACASTVVGAAEWFDHFCRVSGLGVVS